MVVVALAVRGEEEVVAVPGAEGVLVLGEEAVAVPGEEGVAVPGVEGVLVLGEGDLVVLGELLVQCVPDLPGSSAGQGMLRFLVFLSGDPLSKGQLEKNN